MEVGIDLKAAYEDETIYTSDILTIDEEQTLSDVQKAYTQAINLSISSFQQRFDTNFNIKSSWRSI